MPLIQVDLSREIYEELAGQIGDAVHEAQIEALGVPADDRFQIFTPHDSGELRFDPGYNGVDRQQLVLIRVTAVNMYDVPTKHGFFRSVVKRLEAVGIRGEDVLICLTENGMDDWWAGRG